MNRVDVQPALFRWALERAGIDSVALQHRFQKLPEWERGEAKPTLKQLEAFAKATHAPVGYFFLQRPPVEAVPIPDLRTVASQGVTRPTPDLLDTLYLCQQRQEYYRDFARTVGEQPMAFVGSTSVSSSIPRTAEAIRTTLGFDLPARRRMRTWTDALRSFVDHVEALGVLVMISGIVGSNNKRKLNPQEFRGFALADDLAPLVFVNGADTKAAQMFTLAHELAHLWLGETALSDAGLRSTPSQAVERWCNRVAAELLVPEAALRSEVRPIEDLEEALKRLSRLFKVSTLVVLRRMYDIGALDQAEFGDAYRRELARLRSFNTGSGGDFYNTLGARVGKRFARAVLVSTLEGRSSYTEAFQLLGVRKLGTFNDLAQKLGVAA
ncbi:MAG: ImmA/IrrE family metallo-endopeptidase [Pseudomonadota bacterium]